MPLIVESFGEGGRDAATTAATRVVVRDEHGNPLVIAVEHGEGKIHVSHFLDPEFEPLARAFGLVPPRVIQTIPLPGG